MRLRSIGIFRRCGGFGEFRTELSEGYRRFPGGGRLESSLEQLQRLLKEGSGFTFSNFSDSSGGRQYGGQDSPNWLALKTRTLNTIQGMLEETSAPVVLLMRAFEIDTSGYLEDHFLNQRSLILSAIEKAIEIVNEDIFGETKRPKSISTSGTLSNRVFVVHVTTMRRRPNWRSFSEGSDLSQWSCTGSRIRAVR